MSTEGYGFLKEGMEIRVTRLQIYSKRCQLIKPLLFSLFSTAVRLNFTENPAMLDISRSYVTSVNRGLLFILPTWYLLSQIISGTVPLGTRCW